MYTTDKPEKTGMGEGTGEHPHIWLRYATQFTSGGRTHTIEMGIPVPVGATAEMRAQLIREAEVGMDQLSSYVESRVTQMLQRNQRPQSTTTPPSLVASSAPKPISKPSTGSSPASTPPTQDITAQETQKIPVPPTRTHVGASMPLAPGLPGDANAALTLTQFLHFIKGTLGLTHQQAKDLLQVQTLNGLNLREALERLQRLIAQNPAGTTTPEQKPQEPHQPQPLQRPAAPSAPTPMPLPAASARPASKPAASPAPSSAPQSTAPVPLKPLSTATGPGSSSSPGTASTSSTSNTPIDLSTRRAVNDQRPTYRFDEEDDLDEDSRFDDLDDSEARPALSADERLRARTILSKMKDIRGSAASSEGRLKVLHNVISTQVTPEQLQQLLQAFWGTNTPKKLKADQVEELISWAKEDEFANEVEAVLTVLEEE